MADFTFNRFAGSVPRLAPHLIKPGMAQLALDCKLTSGRLESWRELKKVHSFFIGANVGTSQLLECGCWHDFEECVDFAFGSPTCNQVFTTGAADRPSEFVYTFDDCRTEMVWLGGPCSLTPFGGYSVVSTGSTDRDLEGRKYAYRYVKSIADPALSGVGALSPALDIAEARDGDKVTLTGWGNTLAPEWGITGIAVYRTVSGDSVGNETAKGSDTSWMLVGTAPIGAGAFIDDKYNDELLLAFDDSIVHQTPPSGLNGIIWIESINTLAGFMGRELWFSENNNPNNWPHYLTLDDDIKGIVESNGNIYVATSGHPYVIEGAAGCESAECRKVIRLPYSMPMVAKGNRFITATALGAVYPSHKGLVLLAGNGKPVFLTWPWYSAEDWQAMYPHSAITVEFDGKLFCFMQNGAFAITMPDSPESGWDLDGHTDLSDRGVIDAYVTRDGRFFIVKTDGVYEWNRGTALRPHRWVSSETVMPRPYTFGAGHMWFDGGAENVTVTANGREVLNRSVASSQVFRLPMWANGTRWQAEISGTGSVSLLSVAAAMQDLNR